MSTNWMEGRQIRLEAAKRSQNVVAVWVGSQNLRRSNRCWVRNRNEENCEVSVIKAQKRGGETWTAFLMRGKRAQNFIWGHQARLFLQVIGLWKLKGREKAFWRWLWKGWLEAGSRRLGVIWILRRIFVNFFGLHKKKRIEAFRWLERKEGIWFCARNRVW